MKYLTASIVLICALSQPIFGHAEDSELSNEEVKKKLKSVKELFNKKKDSVPQAPSVISNIPEILPLDSVEPSESTIEPQVENSEEVGNSPLSTQPTSQPDIFAPKEGIPQAPQAFKASAPTQATSAKLGANALFPEKTKEKSEEEILKEKSDEYIKKVYGTSVMFDESKIKSVMRVFNAYLATRTKDPTATIEKTEQNTQTLEDLQMELLAKLRPEDEGGSGEKTAVDVRLPAYIKLSSLIYHSNDNKKAWLNSKQYKQGESSNGIKVTFIGKEHTRASLSTRNSPMNSEEILEKLEQAGNSGIEYDIENKELLFRLSVNQYLDLNRMRILEGEFDLNSIDLQSPQRTFYDPKNPADRFAPLEEDKGIVGQVSETFRSVSDAIDSEEEEDDSAFSINSSPQRGSGRGNRSQQ